MNAETAKHHLSRLPDEMPVLVDAPTPSGRSEPRPAEVDPSKCRIWLTPEIEVRSGRLRFNAYCENHTPWWHAPFEAPLHDGQIAELARQHSGVAR